MATVGQVLNAPESGWKRYDNTHSTITYTGTWNPEVANWNYGGSAAFTSMDGATVNFAFYGTKLRIIGALYPGRATNTQVWVDGVLKATINENGSASGQAITLVADIQGFVLGNHVVQIKQVSTASFCFDAVDIDSTGYLLPVSPTIGSQLAGPETGWRRYDDSDPKIKRSGTWTNQVDAGNYNGAVQYSSDTNAKIEFTVEKTSRIRLIINSYNNKPNNVPVSVDGVEVGTYSCYSSAAGYMILGFELTGLSLERHVISIKTPVDMPASQNWTLDAVDVDDTGFIVTPVGKVLSNPDSGWRRADADNVTNHVGQWLKTSNVTGRTWTNGSVLYTTRNGDYMQFYFKGTKLRLINETSASGYSTAVEVSIDGNKEYFSQIASGSNVSLVLGYEKVGLDDKIHSVIIKKNDAQYLQIDSIDIDDTGYFTNQAGDLILETGWAQFDGADKRIRYNGSWTFSTGGSTSDYVGGTLSYSNVAGTSAVIKFKGTKLRILATISNIEGDAIPISIDGVNYGTFSEWNGANPAGTYSYQRLTYAFEVIGLSDTIHTVTVFNQPGKSYNIDAIEIDSDGYLVTQVGQQQSAPDTTWKRYDNTDAKIAYVGGTWTYRSSQVTGAYNNTDSYFQGLGSAKFKFYGTKFRILSTVGTVETNLISSSIDVMVDGVLYGNYSLVNSTLVGSFLTFEGLNLAKGIHTVELINKEDGKYITLDAIDSDSDGYLVAQPGQLLTTPETSWKRFDNIHPAFKYSGTWTSYANNQAAGNINGTNEVFGSAGAKLNFKFYGTKLRLITSKYSTTRADVCLWIDGIAYPFDTRGSASAATYQVLCAEIVGLSEGVHTVEYGYLNVSTGGGLGIDALDIDDTGYLIASVGTVLTTPEAGWKRYDDTHASFKYTGTWIKSAGTTYYNTYNQYVTDTTSTVSFDFIGTKLRMIQYVGDQSSNVSITIDGVPQNYSLFNSTGVPMTLTFEKTDLSQGRHTVVLQNAASGNMTFDAIDIDATGRVLHPDEVVDVKDLVVGKRIRAHYTASSGKLGVFSGFGKETYVNGINDFIPVASSATPSGDFYLIAVANSTQEKMLVADRNIQHTISWSTLNSAGLTNSVITLGNYVTNNNNINASSLVFDGSSNYVTVPTNVLSGKINFTFSAWIKTSQSVAGTARYLDPGIFGSINAAGFTNDFRLSTYNGNLAWYDEFNGSTAVQYSTTTNVADNQWHHVAVSRKGSIISLYVDGQLAGATTTGLNPVNNLGLEIGRGNYTGTLLFNGLMKNVGIWDTSLNSTDINSVFNSGVSSVNGYLVNYVLDENSRINDISGNLNHGIVVGGQSYAIDDSRLKLGLLSSGFSLGDTNNDWNNYIVNSTLNSNIIAGDNKVWNWSGVTSLTSALNLNTGNVVARGNTTNNSYSSLAASTANATTGFRPMLTLSISNDLTGTISIRSNYIGMPNNGYQLNSNAYVLNRFDLPATFYVPPNGFVVSSATVKSIYWNYLSSTIDVKGTDSIPSTIFVPPYGNVSVIGTILPIPRIHKTVVPIEDAFVRSSVPKFNYGKEQELLAGYDSLNNESYQSFFKFVLPSDIQQNPKKLTAKLKLYFKQQTSINLNIYETTNDWSEEGITWDNQPEVVSLIKNISIENAVGYREIDLSEKVLQWINDSAEQKSILITSEDNDFARFSSREFSSKPSLEIEYNDPTITSIGLFDFDSNLSVSVKKNSNLNSKINIKNNFRIEDMQSNITVINRSQFITTIAVNRPDLSSNLIIKQNNYGEVNSSISVRSKNLYDIRGFIGVNKQEVSSNVKVRRYDISDLNATTVIRQQSKNDLTSKFSVKREGIPSLIKVYNINDIYSSIVIRSNVDSNLNSNIIVKQTKDVDLGSSIRVYKNSDIQGNIRVLSGYLASHITVPHDAVSNVKSSIQVRVRFANDVETVLIVGEIKKGSYVFIL